MVYDVIFMLMKTLEGLKQKYETFSEEHPALATLGETAVLFALRYGLEKGGEKIGIPLGHGRRDQESRNDLIKAHPILATGAATLLAPVTEELLFREIPARILEKHGYGESSLVSKRTKLGVAAVFGVAHTGPSAIPLPQFIGGLNYGRIHERRGLKYSILAHVTSNTLAAARYVITNRTR